MLTSIIAAATATFFAAMPQTEKNEEFYASLSVETYDIPERILRPADSFSLQGEYTIDESDGLLSLQGRLEDELNSNDIYFITVDITRFGPNNGTLKLTFQALPEGVRSRTVELRFGGSVHKIVQTRPQRLGYELTPPGRKYPGDSQSITVTGSTPGAKYVLFRGRSQLIYGTETVCDGSPMTFGPYSTNGIYRLYNDDIGFSETATEIADYDIFMPTETTFTGDSLSLPLKLPADGGIVTLDLDISDDLDPALYEEIEQRMNEEGVPGRWDPDKGMSIGLTVKDGHTLSISFTCAPNFSDEPKSNDTGFYVDDYDRTITVIQPGNQGGELNVYELSGEWTDKDTGTFSLVLSGSQPGVTYTLTKDNGTVKTMTGSGKSLQLGTFSGINTFGGYRIYGKYGGKTMQSNAVVMRRTDMPYGNNYILRKTYLDADGDSTVSDVTYYDGLGYPEQTISQHGGGRGDNIVTPIVYDCMRRDDARTYLPFVSSADDIKYVYDATSRQSQWYRTTDTHPYRDKTYEDGVSGRPLSFMREGAIYRERGIKSKLSYSVEDGTGGILKLSYVYPDEESPASVRNDGLWDKNSLQVTISVSEDGDTTCIYADAFGKTIMSRATDGRRRLDTYYVYDMKDSLVCVIQPEGVSRINRGFSFDDNLAQSFCFTWRYDAWGNVIESHVPGGGTVQTIYDQRNRPVLTSDSEMRKRSEWKYTIYDSLDRVTEEGTCHMTADFEDVRLQMQSSTDIASHVSDRQFLQSMEYYSSVDLPSGFEQVFIDMDVSGEGCLTLPRRELLSGIGGPAGLLSERKFFYDRLGRLIETVEYTSDEDNSVTAMQYDFTGNVTVTFEGHRLGGKPYSMETEYTYDDRGRRVSMRRTEMDMLAEVSYTYDDLGRLERTTVGDAGREDLAYNLQGWRTGMDASFFEESIFKQHLDYYSPVTVDAVPSYGGRISGIRTERAAAGAVRDESYTYDGFNRLIGTASLADGRRDVNVEKNIKYDMNGNFDYMTRDIDGDSHDLDFLTDGNRLDGIINMTAGGSRRYRYDDDGRLTYDARVPSSGEGTVYEYGYNILGLLDNAMKDYTTFVEYSYLSDGTRMETKMSDGTSLKYRGNFVFRTEADGRTELESIAYDGGRLVAENRNGEVVRLHDLWHVCDHLGSVRSVVNISEHNNATDVRDRILEENDYMAFGTRFSPYTEAPALFNNRYRYNGKEEQSFAGLPYIDYGARMYDPYAARWNAPDPLAAKYPSTGSYVFCANNPVNIIDQDGMDWFEATDDSEIKKWINSNEETIIDETGVSWKNIGTEYLLFNGYSLAYYTQSGDVENLSLSKDVYGAVSGRKYDGVFDYSKQRQATKKLGPIPEGDYEICPMGIQNYDDLTFINKLASFIGRGSFPGGKHSWGENRVWITPSKVNVTDPKTGRNTIRDKLSIHGGAYPGSAGCIDLYTNAPDFFAKLKTSTSSSIRLTVSYEHNLKVIVL